MYQEKYRPQYHFSPEKQWMNDPNGLVYYKEEYHLFYQYHPESTVWGPMHWGHAISKDLIRWEHLPVALYPDELGTIFSGCCVIDHDNTSGLKTGDEDVMIALFTQHEEGKQKQSIAFSNDCGRTWTKYEGNPVIHNPGLKDFRDPKVFEYKDCWIMSLACGDHIQFYKSENLIHWDYLSSFGKDLYPQVGVWECPDLFKLGSKWVLIVSVNEGAPNGGSGMFYFVGEFDGFEFKSEQSPDLIKWVDYGRDFYAAVTWSNFPTDEVVWIGWMSNWDYANQIPTHPWRSAMSIPRKLSLTEENDLVQQPVDYMERILGKTLFKEDNLQISGKNRYILESFEKVAKIELKIASISTQVTSWGLVLRKGENYQTVIDYNCLDRILSIDRTNCGETTFSEKFPSVDIMQIKEMKNLTIFLDKSSIEIFANNGVAVLSEQFFPMEEDLTFELYANDGEIILSELQGTEIKSIWE